MQLYKTKKDNRTDHRSIVPKAWRLMGFGILFFSYLIYKELIVREAFRNYLDFFIFLMINYAQIELNVSWLLPKVFRNREKQIYRFLLFLVAEIAVLSIVLIGLSMLIGGLTLDLSGGFSMDINNFSELIFVYFGGCFVSVFYYFIILTLSERKKNEWTKKRIVQLVDQVEVHKLEGLKAQLPSHFLSNTMMMLRYTIEDEPHVGVACLNLLCDILDYYSSDTMDGKILLSSEIEQVKRYVELQDLKFGGRRHFVIDIQGNVSGVDCLPMTILLLVENIYKYGVLDDPKHPAELSILAGQRQLIIAAQNPIRAKRPNLPSTGTGLLNLEGRLQHFYPDNHSFSVDDTEGRFKVSISINV